MNFLIVTLLLLIKCITVLLSCFEIDPLLILFFLQRLDSHVFMKTRNFRMEKAGRLKLAQHAPVKMVSVDAVSAAVHHHLVVGWSFQRVSAVLCAKVSTQPQEDI